MYVSDIDGCVAKMHGPLLKYLRERLGVYPPTNEWLDESVMPDWAVKAMTENCFNNEAFLYGLEPYEENAAFLRRCGGSERQKFLFLTSRSPGLIEVTKQWFDKHHIPYSDIISVPFDKKAEVAQEHDAKFLIDDKYEEVKEASFVGLQGYLMDRPWNRKFKCPKVMMNPRRIRNLSYISYEVNDV